MKTAVSIPDSIFRSADSFAKRHGLSRSELYATAVAEFLSRRRGKQITAKLDAVYEEIDSSLDGSVSGLQSRSIHDESW
jgi:metal-responsive CopG/Arc/MetJ family transcriptional regulator